MKTNVLDHESLGIDLGQLYALSELRPFLRLSVNSLKTMIYQKRIKACKIGKTWFVQGQWIIEYMERNLNGAD